MDEWSLTRWRKLNILQQPEYEDLEHLKSVRSKLEKVPPLVFTGEIENLKSHLAKACRGEAFILQGGDCAETFKDFSVDNIRDLLKVFLQMSLVLTYGASKPIVKIARIAGQFAKPRSSLMESKNNETLPVYRGDQVNSFSFDKKSRANNPDNLMKVYNQSASTLNILRGFCKGGFADLNSVNNWNLDFTKHTKMNSKYLELVEDVEKSLAFMEACGIHSENTSTIKEIDIFTSHEALLLNYEETLTRLSSQNQKYYDCSAHFLWIGERTRGIDDAHVDFFSGLENPIGVKISGNAKEDDLLRLIDKLNPNNEEGKLTFITRMGADIIRDELPRLLRAVQREGKNIVWSSDPMHGNTFTTSGGIKSRMVSNILKELKAFFDIHHAEGTIAGGVHLEMTGKDVTECIGGSKKYIAESDLSTNYNTSCDPRLNSNQALEVAFGITEIIQERNKK
jgi:3-deoxy-7-phosphoheptulonate synthase